MQRGLRGVDHALRAMQEELVALAHRESELVAAVADATAPAGDSTPLPGRRADVARELGEHAAQVRAQREALLARQEEVRLQLVRLKAGIGTVESVRQVIQP